MGAKTGLLAYTTDGAGVGTALRARPADSDPGEAETLVRQLHPDWSVAPRPDGVSSLGRKAYPPEGVAYAARLPGVDILCSQDVMVGVPSELPARFLDATQGRTVVLHATHSAVDWLAFAIWRDGVLIRSLSLSPDSGVITSNSRPPSWTSGSAVTPAGRPRTPATRTSPTSATTSGQALPDRECTSRSRHHPTQQSPRRPQSSERSNQRPAARSLLRPGPMVLRSRRAVYRRPPMPKPDPERGPTAGRMPDAPSHRRICRRHSPQWSRDQPFPSPGRDPG
jgi:hypothetical protein